MGFLVCQADALRIPLPDQSVGLVIGSPPYMKQRTYGRRDIARNCEDWVHWMIMVTEEAIRVSKGLVLWVCAGCVKNHNYQPGPEGLLWEWWKKKGYHHCHRPAFWHRIGIPGSGSKQGLRADVEYILGFKRPGPLPWADKTAMGHAPKWAPGGRPTHRTKNGKRVYEKSFKDTGHESGNQRVTQGYTAPKLANPGNLIHTNSGGGNIGDKIAHENEAPFAEKLVEFLIRTYCHPEDMILDPFSGSGTTCAVARDWGRGAIGLDLRESQCRLTQKRVAHSRFLFHGLVDDAG